MSNTAKIDERFVVHYSCEDCGKEDPDNTTIPGMRILTCGYKCDPCKTLRLEAFTPKATPMISTGWNPHEKTFVEYCGKENFHNNHEVLDSVPLDRAAKARIAKSKYDKGV